MAVDRLPSYDPSHGVLSKRGGLWVETWNLRNGVAWRDPLLAERAVAAWQQRRGEELRDVEAKPVQLRRVNRRLDRRALKLLDRLRPSMDSLKRAVGS